MPDKTFPTMDGGARRQEVAPGEYASEVYTRGAFDAAVSLGRAYVLDTGRVTLAVAGNLRITLTNPAGSGVVTTIHAASGMCTATGWASVLDNPTTGLPATAARDTLRLNPNAGAAPATQIKADTNATTALSGGTPTGVVVGFAANNPRGLQLGKVLAPGQSIGINAAFAGSADAAIGFFVTEELL